MTEHSKHDHHAVLELLERESPSEEMVCDLADLFEDIRRYDAYAHTVRTVRKRNVRVCDCRVSGQMTQSAISHQLKVLKDNNLVGSRRAGKTIYYFLADDHVRLIIRAGLRPPDRRKEEIKRRKVFKLDELDCANCGLKMEEAIRKIDGVKSVNISFMTQKLTLEADDARFNDIVAEVVKVCRKVEPDCRVIV